MRMDLRLGLNGWTLVVVVSRGLTLSNSLSMSSVLVWLGPWGSTRRHPVPELMLCETRYRGDHLRYNRYWSRLFPSSVEVVMRPSCELGLVRKLSVVLQNPRMIAIVKCCRWSCSVCLSLWHMWHAAIACSMSFSICCQ